MLSYETLTPDPVFMMHDVLYSTVYLLVLINIAAVIFTPSCATQRSLPCAATAAVDKTGKTCHKPKAGCPPEWTLLSPLGCVLYETS